MQNYRKGIMRKRILRAGSVAGLVAAIGLTACDEPTPPQFQIEGQGTLEGRLFLDEEKDGFFDPSAGDQPLAGVRLILLDRGSEQVLAGPITTDEQGRFSFGEVSPGTHHLLVLGDEDESLPFEAVVCRNPLPVSVFRAEPSSIDIAAQEACLITIAEARETAAGEFVNIRGVVTSHPGQVRSSYVYIQDATGGIQFFTSALNDAGIEIGDRIDVSGVLDEFNSTLQLTAIQLNDVEKGVGAPTPEETTTSEIATAGPDPSGTLQGLLVRVEGARLETGFTSGGSRNATIDDGSGPSIVRVESGVSPESGDAILSALGLEVGQCYDITGLVGAFGSDGQLFPRSADDFEEVPCT